MWWGWWAWGVRDLTAAFLNTRRIAPTRQLAHGVAERFTRAAAAAAGDSWKDSDVSTSSVKLDVFAIPRDERAKSDCDEDGGYSLVMNSFLCDGYTCSIVVLLMVL